MKINFGTNFVQKQTPKSTNNPLIPIHSTNFSLNSSSKVLEVNDLSAGDLIDFKQTEIETDHSNISSGRYLINFIKKDDDRKIYEIGLQNLAKKNPYTQYSSPTALECGEIKKAGSLQVWM